MFRVGLEVLLEKQLDLVRRKRVGLITNHTAVDSKLRHAPDLLREAGVNLVALFGPEHGVRGEVADGVKIENAVDPRLGIPAYSLYGKTNKPTPEMLDDVDVLIFDIQDVGARFYTYLYTMSYGLEAAGEKGIPYIVLDRPNPLGGVEVEGPVLDPEFKSFVGLHPIPNRTGMTVGELATMFNKEFGVKGDLTVVRMEGWKRSMFFEETGFPWVIPSPNMPTSDTAMVYPGTCLFEGTWCSEGRGTVKPFETIGAPWMDSRTVVKEMTTLNLPGVLFRETFFRPTASKFKDEPCAGVQLHITDRKSFKPVLTGLSLLYIIKQIQPDKFEWRVWTPGEHYSIDRLWGTSQIRHQLDAGKTPEEITAWWQPRLTEYDAMRQKYFLYE